MADRICIASLCHLLGRTGLDRSRGCVAACQSKNTSRHMKNYHKISITITITIAIPVTSILLVFLLLPRTPHLQLPRTWPKPRISRIKLQTAECNSMLTLVEQKNVLPLASAAWALNGPPACCNSTATRQPSPESWVVPPALRGEPFRTPNNGRAQHAVLGTACVQNVLDPRSFHASPSARMAACASTSSPRPIQAAYSPAALHGEPSKRVGFNPPGRRRCMVQAKADRDGNSFGPKASQPRTIEGPLNP